jgi:hypothetical protein
MRQAWLALLVFALIGLVGCEGAEGDPGLDARMRVRGAQYVTGPLPSPGAGPAIISLRAPHAQVLPGLRREVLSGSLPPDATSVVLARMGDPGHWIIGAGAPVIEEPELPTFTAELSFARDTPAGLQTLALSAVRGNGEVGPRHELRLDALAPPRSSLLSIELRWDTNADLDLHVVLPDGSELWSGNINSYTPPPLGAFAPDPNAHRGGGVLDLDSNANCSIAGRREERASWEQMPPAGTYVIRVATASLCAESVAHWTLEVWLGGIRTQVVGGISQPWDTRDRAGVGAGSLALALTVP